MNDKPLDHYKFGPYRFSPAQKHLWRDDELVSISPTALEVLSILLEKRPEPASREELLDRVWADTAVEEANVTVAISNIRKTLSSNGSGQQEFIKTIPKKGYLFVGDVEEVLEETAVESDAVRQPAPTHGSTRRWYLIGILLLTTLFVTSFSVWLTWGDGSELSSVPIGEREYKSVAVLPFKQIGKENKPLSLGITDNLISRLARINKFAVRPLSAVESFSSGGEDALVFARNLNVDAVIVGTMQESEDQIRISVRLLDARDGVQLWAETYDEPEVNIFELQDKLSLRAARSLISKLTSEDGEKLTERETGNLDAFRAYNTGQFHLSKRTREDIEKAIPFFEKAVEIDPAYATAYSSLAHSYLLLTDSTHGGDPRDIQRERIENAIANALKYDPSSASAFASKGFLLVMYDWDIEGALNNYDRSIELDPNNALTRNWRAWSLIVKKQFDKANDEMRVAKSLDPTSRIIAAEAGLPLLFAGKYAEAEPLFREAVEMDKNFFQSHFRLWNLLYVSGRYTEAQKEIEIMKGISSESDPFYLGLRSLTLSGLGQESTASELFLALEKRAEKNERVSPMLLASIATALQKKERAKYWLEAAYEDMNDYLLYLDIAPEYRSLKNEPWFEDLVNRIKTRNKN